MIKWHRAMIPAQAAPPITPENRVWISRAEDRLPAFSSSWGETMLGWPVRAAIRLPTAMPRMKPKPVCLRVFKSK